MTPRLERVLRGVLFRLLLALVAFGLGASLTWVYRVEVFGYLLAPAGGALSGTGQPIYTGPTEMFELTMNVVTKGGIVAALPVLAGGVYSMAQPLLDWQQRRTLLLFLGLILVFYAAGMAFAYWVLLPTGLGFLLQFGTDIAVPMIRITEYMELALKMLFWLGIVFQIPVVMLLLVKLRIVSYERFKRLRRYFPAAAIFLSMLITPGDDIGNIALLAGPIIALYEVGLRLAWLARPKVRA